MAIRGSCHCGRVAYRLEADPDTAIQCNCSICRRKGYLLAFAEPHLFTLETAREELTVYQFGRHTIRHQFCRTCGCAPFGEGKTPDGTEMVAVNLRCAEDVDLDAVTITPVDGASF